EVNEISKSELERNGMAFVTKIVRKKEGPEFQMGSLKFTKKLARALQKKHGGQVSESFRMTGYDRQEGKPRYRATVVLRLPQLEEGKYILYDGTLWRISHMADKVTLANFSQTLALDFKKIEKESSSGNLRMVGDDVLVPGMMVSVGEGGSQVMRMDDYSTIDLEPESVPRGAEQGKRVLILKEGARYYLVNP
ncbi:MAG: hypothetical protein JW825_00025, partial [Candidatus Methanofastidiosa archaeon]|nr:hypothetical protein [Candidatus Methanofastidiosa archaeon]